MDENKQTPPNYQPSPSGYPYPPGYQQAPYGNRYVGLVEAYKAYWKNYGNFNDRTSRAGYWWAILMFYIIFTASGIIVGVIGEPNAAGTIFAIWILANIIPMLSIAVRRLHDVGKNWAWILIRIIPFVGEIIFIVITATAQKFLPENRFAHLPQV